MFLQSLDFIPFSDQVKVFRVTSLAAEMIENRVLRGYLSSLVPKIKWSSKFCQRSQKVIRIKGVTDFIAVFPEKESKMDFSSRENSLENLDGEVGDYQPCQRDEET